MCKNSKGTLPVVLKMIDLGGAEHVCILKVIFKTINIVLPRLEKNTESGSLSYEMSEKYTEVLQL